MRSLFLALVLVVIFSCSSDGPNIYIPEGVSHGDIPRIHTIGDSSIITFDGTEQHVTIPVRGRHLQGSPWNVSIVGVSPLRLGKFNGKDFSIGDFFFVVDTFDYGEIVINKEYFAKRGQNNDRLNIAIGLHTSPARKKFISELAQLENGGKLPTIPAALERTDELQKALCEVSGALPKNGDIKLLNATAFKEKVSLAKTAAEKASAKDEKALAPVIRKTFSLRSAKSYRESDLSQRVSFSDLKAFPLSSETVRELFGEATDDAFYVVAIRIRNPGKENRFVTTGLISAQGSVAIFPRDEDSEPVFTIPVKVTPRRASLVYKYVDDDSLERPRAWFFRSLTFVGALATGFGSVFDYSKNLTQVVSLFTGIAIPEGDKLWPNRERRNLANIVTFSLPDLVKVPAMSSAGGILFFSKRELHSLVSDPSHLAIRNRRGQGTESARGSGGTLGQSSQLLAQLEMESFDIIYEKSANEDEARALRILFNQINADAVSRRNRAFNEAQAAADVFTSALSNGVAAVADGTGKLLIVKQLEVKPSPNPKLLPHIALDLKLTDLKAANDELKSVWTAIKADPFKNIKDRFKTAVTSVDALVSELGRETEPGARGRISGRIDRQIRDIDSIRDDWKNLLLLRKEVAVTPAGGSKALKTTTFKKSLEALVSATTAFKSALSTARADLIAASNAATGGKITAEEFATLD
ncbi:MAG: hypothetical protein V3W41_08585 [Planctomycetota bacterium]